MISEFIKKLFFIPSNVYNLINFKIHNVTLGDVTINGRLRLYGKGQVTMGNGVRINSNYRMNPIGGNQFTSFYTKKGAIIEIGEETGISNVSFYASEKITIGKRCMFGGGVRIYDTDFHSIDSIERSMKNDNGVKTEPVTIGDDVFIGAHCIILKGVTIGSRSVIGAGAVITKNIASDEVWAGNPAKFIKNIGGQTDEIMD